MCKRIRIGGLACTLLAVVLASCSARPQAFIPAAQSAPGSSGFANASDLISANGLPTPIRHIVIVFQENRTPDYLFQGIPGADISKTAVDQFGKTVALHEVPLGAPYDLDHSHHGFEKDYDGGKMDGFDRGLDYKHHLRPFGYAPESEVRPYHDLAKQYVLADHMFQSNQGPSFPAHLYIVSGTATQPGISDYRVLGNPFNPITGKGRGGGCDAPPGTLVHTINVYTGLLGSDVFPCFDRPVLSDFLDKKGISWRYYQHFMGPGLWHAFNAIRHVRYGPGYANVTSPPQTILTDISKGRLSGVSWVMPDGPHSDHANQHGSDGGPSWVAAIVNAIGTSKYWQSTAIFVTWDDWGGWYDHVPPPMQNHYELGFRVPLLVISPYARQGYVSNVQHEFGSILAFSEEAFGIPKGSLGSTDRRADDLIDAFNFQMHPRRFVPIKAPPFNPGLDAAEANAEDP